MKNTKEKILETALELFAEKGYEAVSVSDIAGKLGMTKGALYKHYTNKQDILDSIFKRMEESDAQQAEKFDMPQEPLTAEGMRNEYQNTDFHRMIEFSRAQFRYWTEDAFASAFRRMLTLEQYCSPEMMELYQQYLAGGPLGYVRDILRESGSLNAELEALQLYAPMFMLYSVFDGAKNEEEREAARQLAERFFKEMEK